MLRHALRYSLVDLFRLQATNGSNCPLSGWQKRESAREDQGLSDLFITFLRRCVTREECYLVRES